jgi:hypothetical protein
VAKLIFAALLLLSQVCVVPGEAPRPCASQYQCNFTCRPATKHLMHQGLHLGEKTMARVSRLFIRSIISETNMLTQVVDVSIKPFDTVD